MPGYMCSLLPSALLMYDFPPRRLRAILGKRLDLLDVSRFDPQLGSTLERMQGALSAHAAATAAAGGSGGELLLDGVPISDLCLTFTLPGYPDHELRPGGADIMVEGSNLQEVSGIGSKPSPQQPTR